jgi:hypothetical protein
MRVVAAAAPAPFPDEGPFWEPGAARGGRGGGGSGGGQRRVGRRGRWGRGTVSPTPAWPRVPRGRALSGPAHVLGDRARALRAVGPRPALDGCRGVEADGPPLQAGSSLYRGVGRPRGGSGRGFLRKPRLAMLWRRGVCGEVVVDSSAFQLVQETKAC